MFNKLGNVSLKKKVPLINSVETVKMESSSSWNKCTLHSDGHEPSEPGVDNIHYSTDEIYISLGSLSLKDHTSLHAHKENTHTLHSG